MCSFLDMKWRGLDRMVDKGMKEQDKPDLNVTVTPPADKGIARRPANKVEQKELVPAE